MFRVKTIALLTALTSLVAASAAGETIRARIEFEPPLVSFDEGGYAHVTMAGCLNLERPGAPALPSRAAYLLLPPGHEVISATSVPAGVASLPGKHRVAPAPRLRPPRRSGTRPLTPLDPLFYESRKAFPEVLTTFLPVQSRRGLPLLPMVVRPVKYEAATGRLSWAGAVEINVVTAPATDKLAVRELVAFRGFERDLEGARRLLLNPAALPEARPSASAPTGQDYRYLVVTSQTLASCGGEHTLQALTAEKEARGISTYIATIGEIVAAWPGVDDAERLRNFLVDAYENHGTDYVLLAGDADRAVIGGDTQPTIVPVRGLWGLIDVNQFEVVQDRVETDLVSDLYFACLDGDFNADGDGVWGEPEDDPDLLAELVVGRAPADSCEEVANFVRKNLSYRERQDGELNRVLLAGEYLYPGMYSGPELESIREGGYEWGHLFRGFAESAFFDVETMYDWLVCHKDCWDKFDLLAAMNEGLGILHHSGHSITNINMRMDCGDIEARLNNREPFLHLTDGCYSGAFDNSLGYLNAPYEEFSQEDCFAEYLVLGEHGAFASISNTRYGIGTPFGNIFWDQAFGHGRKRPAEMLTAAKDFESAWVANPYVRWDLYTRTYFGDPEASLHLSDQTGPVLGVARTGLQFAAVQGRAGGARCRSAAVRNDGGGSLEWSIAAVGEWLTVDPAAGVAPTEVMVCIDPNALEPDAEYQVDLTVEAPGAHNSPAAVPVSALISSVPSLAIPYTASSPVLDGVIGGEEYAGALSVDVSYAAAGVGVAHIVHDGDELHLGMTVADPDHDEGDGIQVFLDADNNGVWPEGPGDDGVFIARVNGQVVFYPIYLDGSALYGDPELAPEGFRMASSHSGGVWTLEIGLHLASVAPAQEADRAFGLGIASWDFVPGDPGGGEEDTFDYLAVWPQVLMAIGIEDCSALAAIGITAVRQWDSSFWRPSGDGRVSGRSQNPSLTQPADNVPLPPVERGPGARPRHR